MTDQADSEISRRAFLRDATLGGIGIALTGIVGNAAPAAGARSDLAAPASDAKGNVTPVAVHWLGDAAPLTPAGTSWGVPWARGAVPGKQEFQVQVDGRPVPTQSWPLAYWPDGSLKWSGLAIAADPGLKGSLSVVPGASIAPAQPVTVRENRCGSDGFRPVRWSAASRGRAST